jgi:hypothetical protein
MITVTRIRSDGRQTNNRKDFLVICGILGEIKTDNEWGGNAIQWNELANANLFLCSRGEWIHHSKIVDALYTTLRVALKIGRVVL